MALPATQHDHMHALQFAALNSPRFEGVLAHAEDATVLRVYAEVALRMAAGTGWDLPDGDRFNALQAEVLRRMGA
jgi:hypothetical protein